MAWQFKTEEILSVLNAQIPKEKGVRKKDKIDVDLVEHISNVASLVGSPMGFFPFLMLVYQAGLGQIDIQTAQRYYTPTRLTPELIAQLYRRDFNPQAIGAEGTTQKPYGERWIEDLRDLGWSEERIAGFRELTNYLPSPQDLVLWQAKEVFEDDAIRKYGLADEFEKLRLDLFAKAGVTEEQAKNFWIAHWQHPSFQQVVELIRRRHMTLSPDLSDGDLKALGFEDADISQIKEAYEWFRLVEIPPFWRHKLAMLVKETPTRVDIRRFFDLGVINEEELRDMYRRHGYYGSDLDTYVLWTKVYCWLPDLVAQYSKGWIPPEQITKTLVSWGMSEERANEVFKTKVQAPVGQERIVKEKDLTKAEIYRGIKQGVIDTSFGTELLEQMGYDPQEAAYLIYTNTEGTSSPETPLEFQAFVNKFKKATGKEVVEIPESLLSAEKQYIQARHAVDKAREESVGPPTLSSLETEMFRTESILATEQQEYELLRKIQMHL